MEKFLKKSNSRILSKYDTGARKELYEKIKGRPNAEDLKKAKEFAKSLSLELNP